MRLDLDCPVSCADGPFGELADVVVDSSSRRVTHLVVQPHDQHYRARLVAIGRARIEDGTKDVALDCTLAEIDELKPLHRAEYVRLGDRPAEDADSDIGIEADVLPLPYGSLGTTALGAGIEPLDVDPHLTLSYDRVPKGTVEIRRESEVRSSDGHHVGHVVAVVLDAQQHISDVVMEHGHLWGKRQVAIPNASIDRLLSDEVLLSVAKDEIGR
jgi:sporulation protein YlmC with PRC-barrel domain